MHTKLNTARHHAVDRTKSERNFLGARRVRFSVAGDASGDTVRTPAPRMSQMALIAPLIALMTSHTLASLLTTLDRSGVFQPWFRGDLKLFGKR